MAKNQTTTKAKIFAGVPTSLTDAATKIALVRPTKKAPISPTAIHFMSRLVYFTMKIVFLNREIVKNSEQRALIGILFPEDLFKLPCLRS